MCGFESEVLFQQGKAERTNVGLNLSVFLFNNLIRLVGNFVVFRVKSWYEDSCDVNLRSSMTTINKMKLWSLN